MIPERRLSIGESEPEEEPRGRGSDVAPEDDATLFEVRQDIAAAVAATIFSPQVGILLSMC